MTAPAYATRLAIDPARRKIVVRVGKVEIGQHVHDAFRKLAARDLGIDEAMIEVAAVSTDRSPDDGLTAGSLSMQVTGAALSEAALDLIGALRDAAARRLNTSPDAVHLDPTALVWRAETGVCDLFDLTPDVGLEPVSNDPAATAPSLAASITGARLFIQDIVMDGALHARALRGRDAAEVLAVHGPDVWHVSDGGFGALVARRESDLLAAWGTLDGVAEGCATGDAGCDGPVADWIESRRAITSTTSPRPGITAGTVSMRATRPFILHASIAPACGLALFENGTLTVWTHSQGIFQLRGAMARALSMDPETIVIHHVPSAGCYGHNGADDAAMDAALVALQHEGYPVRVCWSRADEFAYAPVGAPMLVEAAADLAPDGEITAWHQEIWSGPHGQRPGSGGNVNLIGASERDPALAPTVLADVPAAAGGGADRNAAPPYVVGALSVTTHIVQDLPVRASSLRGLGTQMNTIATEALADRLAARAGHDPLAWRLAHLQDPRAIRTLQSLSGLLSDAAAGLGESEAIGIAYCRYKGRAAHAAVAARVRLDDTAELREVWTVVDAGTVVDEDGARNQIEGGIIQAASWTLREGVFLRDGRLDAAGWDDYPIHGWADVPRMHIRFEPHERDAPALGVGECMVGPVSAAIVNAVSQIVGQPVTDLPLTRERLIATMAGG